MKRPLPITIAAVLLGLWALAEIAALLAIFGQLTTGDGAIELVKILAIGLAAVGLWRMQIWGPLLFLAVLVVDLVQGFGSPAPGPEWLPSWAVFVPIVVYTVLILAFWRRFKPFSREVAPHADS